MGGPRRKGTVTPLESQFPAEEVQKATKHFEDAIAEKNNELHQLQTFVNDNNNLINLVQKLPKQLSHDVMVPFGKAAFFPGRLIHTNEFMEGLVEIREEYVEDEDDSDEEESEPDSPAEDAPSLGKDTAKEVDYASFLKRMDELEKIEELAEKNGDCSDEDEETTDDYDDSPCQIPVDNNPQNREVVS